MAASSAVNMEHVVGGGCNPYNSASSGGVKTICNGGTANVTPRKGGGVILKSTKLISEIERVWTTNDAAPIFVNKCCNRQQKDEHTDYCAITGRGYYLDW